MSQLRFALGVGALALLALTCGPNLEPELTLTPSPRTINGEGEEATISVSTLDEEGKPGAGTVTFTVMVGEVDEPTVLLDSNGETSVKYGCRRSKENGCTGSVKVNGSWTTRKGKKATATATIAITPAVDAGIDAGTVDAGRPDAGMMMDAGIDAGPPSDAGLTLMASRGTLFLGTQDVVTLNARLTGVSPAEGQELQFSTNGGRLRTAADAGVASAITVRTDATGLATAELVDSTGQAAMLATITATHAASTKSASATVDLLSLRQVSHVRTRCGITDNCALLGVRGSGYQETAQVTFKVTDALARPAVGVRVHFSLNTPPADVMLDKLSEITNSMGEVTAAVQSGTALGVFAVQAVVVPGTVEGSSPTLVIRGAKPANKQFRLSCATVNVPAYRAVTPPRSLSVTCTVRVVDRNNNPVGTGLSVSLKTEAGNVGNSVATTAYMGTGANEGIGTFTFDTTGGTWPPVATTPFTADSAQFPFPREAEPQQAGNNPRDGLITIMAYVVGEEYFADNNGNGVYDLGEPFVDQGEPFVDSNDNNVWDPGETIIPEVGGTPNWDPPNGVHDSTKIIWTETKILATGSAEPGLGTIEGTNPGLCPSGVPKGSAMDFGVFLPDLNLNRVQAGSSLSFTRIGTRGSVAWVGGTTLLDGYGFQYERVLVNAMDVTQDCTPSTPRCVWQPSFGRWERGGLAVLRVSGAATTDMMSCADELGIQAQVNVLSTTVSTAPLSIGIQ